MSEVLDENEIYCCTTCLTEHPNLVRIGTLTAASASEVCEFCGNEYWRLCVAVEKEQTQ